MSLEKYRTEPIGSLLKKEIPQLDSEPQWELVHSIPSIRIFGPAGAGKTTMADALSHLLGVPILKVGQQDRKMCPTDTDYRERELAYDIAVDAELEQVMKDATIDLPIIAEANMAGPLGNKVDATRKEKGISILVTAAEDKRIARIRPRQNAKRVKENKPELSEEETREQTRRRHQGNIETWRKLHDSNPNNKIIGDEDPYLAGAKDPQGNLFATIIIDTTEANSPEETVALMIQRLSEEGLIKRKIRETQVYPEPARAKAA